MMTREEVAEVITYCKENGISYKERLTELGIPIWKFYDSKAQYVQGPIRLHRNPKGEKPVLLKS